MISPPRGTEMFQFPRCPSPSLCVQEGDGCTSAAGFSHSGTPGSKAVCASPGTIAACRALRRLPAPRHPPCARDIFPPLGGATVHSCMNSQDVNVGNLVSLNIQVRR